MSSFPHRWPLWLQVTTALVGAALLVSYGVGVAARAFETRYLRDQLQAQARNTFSLVSSVAIEAVIAEDAPVLQTMARQLIKSAPDIYSVRVLNEVGVVLAFAQRPAITEGAPRLTFSEPVRFNGETFGRMEIVWSTERIDRDIERHVEVLRWAVAAVLLFFVVLIIGLLRLLALAPIRALHARLIGLSRGGSQGPVTLPPYVARELARLGETVSELVAYQQALQASEQRLAEAQRVALIGHWEWILTTDAFHCSEQIYRLLGISPMAALPGYDRMLDFVPPDDRARVRAAIDDLIAQDGSSDLGHRIIREDGMERYVQHHMEAFRDGTGRVVRVLGTMQDITERKRAEEALRETEARFRGIFQSSPLGIVTLDSQGAIAESNHAFQHIFSYTPEELRGMELAALALSEDAATVRAHLLAVTPSDGGDVRFEARFRRRSGEVIWTRTLATRVGVLGPHGQVFAMVEDITERKQAEDSLTQAAQVFESSTEGVIITDAAARIIKVNKAFSEISGYAPEEVIGQNPRLLQSGRHGDEFFQSLWRMLETTGHWDGEIWNRRKRGEIFPEWLNINSIKDASGRVTHYVGVFADITHIKRSEEQLEYLAHHDALTGLPNRLLFTARLEHALERARREHHEVGLLFLDLDRFKTLNDNLGHPAGDELLQAVGERLVGCVREEDTLARQGGDEFVAILARLAGSDDARIIAQRMVEALARPFWIQEREVFITVSIGIAIYPDDGADAKALLKNADTAMYQAKAGGRNMYQFYRPELTAAALERFSLETLLRGALARGELYVVYQPQVSLVSGHITGVEALLRWRHPLLGEIPAAQFIPLAEETGLIEPIGAWILHAACAQEAAWTARGLRPVRLAVNLSAYQIARGSIVATVADVLARTGLPAGQLELEITEEAFVGECEPSHATLDALRALGVTLAIDDFGTGYSNLGYLKRMPIHCLKIDKSFVQGIAESANDTAITRAVIALGHSLQLKVVAEGVETDAQLAFLREQGCDEMQGFLYSMPIPADDLALLLNADSVLAAARRLT